MKASRILVTAAAAVVVAAPLMTAGPASAAPSPKPAAKACTTFDGSVYACLRVADQTVPSGDTATFTGTLSPAARSALSTWTKGDNIVCLTRYKTTLEADGSWPWQVLEGACTTVRKDGGFTINAELGRKGTFFYGVEMGPCRANADVCGNADPGLVGPAKRAVQLKTT